MSRITKHPVLMFEIAALCFLGFMAVIAPLVYAEGPLQTSAEFRLTPPSAAYLFGTDEYGRDILSRVCYGLRVSFGIGLSVTAVSAVTGCAVGLLCGLNGKADKIISRVLDGVMAFPEIILAISLAAVWGSGARNIILAMSIAFFPKMTRVVRSGVIAVKGEEYILSGRAIGAGTMRLVFRYILPGCASATVVQATYCFAQAVLGEAALSFLGVGIREPAPSLGGMVASGRNFMTVAPWTILIPGAVIMLLVLVLNLLGDSLRDIFDPRYNGNAKKKGFKSAGVFGFVHY